MFIYICTCIYIHKHIYIYIPVCIYFVHSSRTKRSQDRSLYANASQAASRPFIHHVPSGLTTGHSSGLKTIHHVPSGLKTIHHVPSGHHDRSLQHAASRPCITSYAASSAATFACPLHTKSRRVTRLSALTAFATAACPDLTLLFGSINIF